MKIKDIDFTLKIKNYKAAKYLRVLLLDTTEEFERKHPSVIPALERALKNGDGRFAREKAEQFVEIINNMKASAEQLLESIDSYMCDELTINDGEAVPFINPDGNQAWSMKDDEKVIIGGKKKEEPKKEEVKKKRVTKKAPKKKTTKPKKDK
jgi:type IV secretory pathway VirB4 component